MYLLPESLILCTAIHCPKLNVLCSVYSPEGMMLRDRRGYCPIPADGPAKPKVIPKAKKRVGQQKQKKEDK